MIFKRIKARGIPRLLLRYLSEVLIIFLGITISFLFEQWREEKRQEKDLMEISESLLSDIDALKARLKYDLGGSTTWIRHLDSLRVQRNSDRVSEQELIWFYGMLTGQNVFLFDPYSPTYMSAVGNGLINELPDSINNKLYNIYRIQLPLFQVLYDQQEGNVTNFRNNTMLQTTEYLYQKDVQLNPDVTVLVKEIKRPVYGNFINQVILTEQEVYKMNKEIFDILTELQVSLRKYIDRYQE